MRSKFILFMTFLNIFLGCSSQPVRLVTPKQEAATQPIAVQEERFLVRVGCAIFDISGQPVRSLPGGRCIFNRDGSFISGDSTTLSFYSKEMKLVWQLPMHTHHIITKTADGNLLVGSSEIKKFSGKNTRIDLLLVVSPDGKILQRLSVLEMFRQRTKWNARFMSPHIWPFKWDPAANLGVDFEYTHLNSFYEIPENLLSINDPAFRKGNIIANFFGPEKTLILTPDLKKVLKRVQVSKREPWADLHDVQILANGNLLAFRNSAFSGGAIHSELLEIEPRNSKIVWRFIDTPPGGFHTPLCGSVQLLADNKILFSDFTGEKNRFRIIDRNGRAIVTTELPTYRDENGKASPYQEVKHEDLAEFLKNNQQP